MRIKLALISLCIALPGCFSKTNSSDISAFEYSTISYAPNSMGRIVALTNSAKIYYYNSFVIYEMSIYHEKPEMSNKQYSSNDEALDAMLNKNNYIAYKRYMIAKLGDTTALQYDMRPDTTTTIVNLNQRLKIHTLEPKQLESLGNYAVSPTSVIRDKHTGKIIKEVFAINDSDPAAVDTAIRYFDDDLKGAKFTFSKKQDEEKKSKFWKCEWISNPYPYTRADGTVIMLPKTSTIWQFKKIDAPSPTLIDNLLGRYRKEMTGKTK